MTLVGQFDYAFNTNDIWGYMAPNGDEYALVGTRRGLSIVSISEDPIHEVAFLEGSNSTWRDIKTWGDFAYVSTEAADGLMVVDLRNLPAEAPFYFWTPEIERPNQPGIFDVLRTIHNVFIDEFGILHITGSNVNNGGVIFVDVNTTPGVPSILGLGPAVYSHDSYGRDSILYSSEIYNGTLGIYDYSDLSNITLLGLQETPFKFTHNAWPSDDSKTVFTTDERGNAPVTSYDISDFGDIQELDRYVPAETVGQGVVPHNVHVLNDWLVISYYADGGKIVDASRPDNLIEVGNFDTFFDLDPGFGAWGAYPFLPSGKVLITDSGNGLFVLSPNYVRAAFLEGTVKGKEEGIGGGSTEVDIFNARVEIIDEEFVLPEFSKEGGVFKTGKAIAGEYLVQISAEGYQTWEGNVVFENGVVTELDVVLEPLTTSVKNDPQIIEQITLFPNPASIALNIDLQNLTQSIYRMIISDENGRTMFETVKINQNLMIRVPTNQWPPAIYFVRFFAEDGSQISQKILVGRE
jgi:choice-of-anchor B domain-containing protein